MRSSGEVGRRGWQTQWGFVACLFLALALAPAGARAAAPSLLWQAPGLGSEENGTGAGRLQFPAGVAADPASGHVYVADNGNARVDEFTPWGGFVKAWGWGVEDGALEPQVCTAETGCLAGIGGSGAGQLSDRAMGGIAVDPSNGDIYVLERALKDVGVPEANYRVQKFNSAGGFLLMFGGAVDKGPSHPGNLCTAAYISEGDACGAGVPGTGNAQFANEQGGTYIAVGPDGTVYVGDKGRIQEFQPNGTYKSQIDLPEEEKERSSKSLAVDPVNGDLYFTFAQETWKGTPEKPFIYKHTVSGWEPFAETGLPEDPADPVFKDPVYGFPLVLAIDSSGDLYVAALEKTAGDLPWEEVLKFDSNGDCLLCVRAGVGKVESGRSLRGLATSSACSLPSPDLFVSVGGSVKSHIGAYGPPPNSEVCPPPKVAPGIGAQYAVSVASDGATVRAKINPHFWFDTSYHVEYGAGKCSAGECQTKVPAPPGAQLGAGTIDAPVTTGAVFLANLQPETTYHLRFVSESSGGGPVYGVDPDGEGLEEASFEEGKEATFTTPPLVKAPPPCPANDAFRTGPGAFLPDCRAYEMVSPIDKDNGDIIALGDVTGYPAALNQSANSGEAISYSTNRSFGDAKSAPYTSQYLASRDPNAGWSSRGVSPPRGAVPILPEGGTLQTEFRAFSADLCMGWIMHDTDPILASGAVEGYANLYRTDDLCGSGGYEALSTGEEAPSLAPNVFIPELQGVSADGKRIIFSVNDQLLPEATTGVKQVYESSGGKLNLVNVLPGGLACSLNSSAGTENAEGTHIRTESVQRAMSADGTRIYWSCGERIYLRVEGESESKPVSQTVSGANARYWTAAVDGSRGIFSIGEKLYEYDAESEASTLITGKVDGVLGASGDASRVYLVSGEGLDGGVAGKHNLYLFEGGTPTYIATLSADDARTKTGGTTPSPINIEAVKHSARVSGDGLHLAFMSSASLTGYDNSDAESGEANAEVFLYGAAAEKLSCASCNPTGARPSGREVEPSTSFWAAALLPPANSQLYQPRYLSDDGEHLFFESFEALVPRDTNGKQDVYEFEPASVKAQCEAIGAELFLAAEGGCLSLISSGQGPADSEFVDASPDGRDVFFTTGASLVPQDPGLIDIYDAREGGGFPPPPSPPAECEGQACQNPAAAPNDPTPASANFAGPGNVKPKQQQGCPRGKHRVKKGGKTVCAKKKKKHRKHQQRRAAR